MTRNTFDRCTDTNATRHSRLASIAAQLDSVNAGQKKEAGHTAYWASRGESGRALLLEDRDLEVPGCGERMEEQQRGDADEEEAQPEEESVADSRHVDPVLTVVRPVLAASVVRGARVTGSALSVATVIGRRRRRRLCACAAMECSAVVHAR